MTIATAVPVGQGVGIGSCKSTARRKGGGRGGAKWKKKRSIRRRGLCGILPCEDKLTPPLLCSFGVVISLCKCGNLLTVGCVQYGVDDASGNGVQCKGGTRPVKRLGGHLYYWMFASGRDAMCCCLSGG